GRAGRTQPGVCIRLWSEAEHRGRAEQTEPEIRRVDLAGPVLQLLAWGEKDVLHFPWLAAPPENTVVKALGLLRRLAAAAGAEVPELARVLARLPVHPRLGCLLVHGQRWGHAERAALAAALLAERDPFMRGEHKPHTGRHDAGTSSDVLDRIEALEGFERNGRTETAVGTLNRAAARFVLHARDQLLRLFRPAVKGVGPAPEQNDLSADEALLRALLAAFPDRVARRRQPGSRQGVIVGGRGVRLAPSSAVTDSELFLCIDVDAGGSEALVRHASAIQRARLPRDRIVATTDVVFDAAAERVTARRCVRYEDLLLEEGTASMPDEERVTKALVAAASEHLERVLPPAESAAGAFLLRLDCLRQW